MQIGVLGTGIVGRTLATKLVELGHEVRMGSRQASNDAATAWATANRGRGSNGTFAESAAFGELVINATSGQGALEALNAAGREHLDGKVLIDVSNAIDQASGFPPSLFVSSTDSLGAQIQRAFPNARVVKTLNTVTADVMVNPGMIKGGHSVFMSGNDADAKGQVAELLQSFGWSAQDIVDLGDISTAVGPEMYLVLWLRIMLRLGHAHFNVRVVREG